MARMNLTFFVVIVLLSVLHSATSRDSMALPGKKFHLPPRYCIAKSSLSADELMNVIDYYCKQPGVDCSVILPGGSCFQPNTLNEHATVVLNRYTNVPQIINPCPEDVGLWWSVDPSSGTCKYL